MSFQQKIVLPLQMVSVRDQQQSAITRRKQLSLLHSVTQDVTARQAPSTLVPTSGAYCVPRLRRPAFATGPFSSPFQDTSSRPPCVDKASAPVAVPIYRVCAASLSHRSVVLRDLIGPRTQEKQGTCT
eukprot:6172236-Pleurochrysis_carterae.AAC.5